MKHINSIFIIILMVSAHCSAQEIVRQVTAVGGETSSTVSYTIGETFVSTNEVLNVITGFQQPDFIEEKILGTVVKDISLSLEVYPNPSVRMINVNGEFSPDETEVSVFNLNGTAVHLDIVFGQNLQVDFDGQPSGIYFLMIQNLTKQTIAKFKIVKK